MQAAHAGCSGVQPPPSSPAHRLLLQAQLARDAAGVLCVRRHLCRQLRLHGVVLLQRQGPAGTAGGHPGKAVGNPAPDSSQPAPAEALQQGAHAAAVRQSQSAVQDSWGWVRVQTQWAAAPCRLLHAGCWRAPEGQPGVLSQHLGHGAAGEGPQQPRRPVALGGVQLHQPAAGHAAAPCRRRSSQGCGAVQGGAAKLGGQGARRQTASTAEAAARGSRVHTPPAPVLVEMARRGKAEGVELQLRIRRVSLQLGRMTGRWVGVQSPGSVPDIQPSASFASGESPAPARGRPPPHLR